MLERKLPNSLSISGLRVVWFLPNKFPLLLPIQTSYPLFAKMKAGAFKIKNIIVMNEEIQEKIKSQLNIRVNKNKKSNDIFIFSFNFTLKIHSFLLICFNFNMKLLLAFLR